MTAELHLTRQRMAVREVIQQSDTHLSVQEIYDLARERLPGIAYATVYNSLAYLRTAGLVGEVHLRNGRALFDRRTDRHDHLWCRRCGVVIDCQFPDVQVTQAAIADEAQFKIERAYVVAEGLCATCQGIAGSA